MNSGLKIGFMQGRLSPMVNGRIQAFPWDSWQEEFRLAALHEFHLLEWTLDQDGIYQNPLLTAAGQSEIRTLSAQCKVTIPSLTGDCFMQAPFWKSKHEEREKLQDDFKAVVRACAAIGSSMIVVPLVDNGRIETQEQEDSLVDFLSSQRAFLLQHRMQVIFESDFPPVELARLIARFDSRSFGINYDIGNSAALGFDPVREIDAYGARVLNVHVKDRVLGGTTVPLGTGNADFETVFDRLAKIGYAGNYILQTARATDGDHAAVLRRYRDITMAFLERHAA